MTAIVHIGNVLDILPTLEAGSVNCVVTSPPYWGLRDYGTDGQLGLESTPEEYVASMVAVFREVRRVLRDDGTLWLNLGDSYASAYACDRRNVVGQGSPEDCARPNHLSGVLKEKDLCGIPWRVAFALQADGWYLRSDIIWSKPNPMPESVTDRPTKAHEYVFLMSKAARYWYDGDAIREPQIDAERGRGVAGGGSRKPGMEHEQFVTRWAMNESRGRAYNPAGRNRRTVWTIATQPYPEAHFATYPEKLVEPCVLAGCPAQVCIECGAPWERSVESFDTGERAKMPDGWATHDGGHGSFHRDGREKGETGIPVMGKRSLGWRPTCDHDADTIPGTVLDPFTGSGTTGVVACRLGRNFVGVELSPEYAEMAERRIAPHRDQMQLDVTP